MFNKDNPVKFKVYNFEISFISSNTFVYRKITSGGSENE
jgi:hypothetical protein